MAKLLKSEHSARELKRLIQQIHHQINTVGVNRNDPKQFDYAKILVFSQSKADVDLGIQYLRSLEANLPERSTDYCYYQIVGHARNGEYADAVLLCNTFLDAVGQDEDVKALKNYVLDAIAKDIPPQVRSHRSKKYCICS